MAAISQRNRTRSVMTPLVEQHVAATWDAPEHAEWHDERATCAHRADASTYAGRTTMDSSRQVTRGAVRAGCGARESSPRRQIAHKGEWPPHERQAAHPHATGKGMCINHLHARRSVTGWLRVAHAQFEREPNESRVALVAAAPGYTAYLPPAR
jgi:hypothetical protein